MSTMGEPYCGNGLEYEMLDGLAYLSRRRERRGFLFLFFNYCEAKKEARRRECWKRPPFRTNKKTYDTRLLKRNMRTRTDCGAGDVPVYSQWTRRKNKEPAEKSDVE